MKANDYDDITRDGDPPIAPVPVPESEVPLPTASVPPGPEEAAIDEPEVDGPDDSPDPHPDVPVPGDDMTEDAFLFEPSRQIIMVSQPADNMPPCPARLADSDAAPQSPAEVLQVHPEDTAVAESRYLGTVSDTPILPSGAGNCTRVDVSIQPLQREQPMPPLTSHESFFRRHFLSTQHRSIPVTGPTSYACSSCRIKLDVESLCICRRCIAACHDYCLLDGVCGYCRPRVDDE